MPHPPQFSGSVCVSMHVPPQSVSLEPAQPHAPSTHASAGAHTVPQPPQFHWFVRVSVQKLPPLGAEQLVSPLGQEQTLDEQVPPGPQDVEHEPQRSASELRSMHEPPQSVVPAPQTHAPPGQTSCVSQAASAPLSIIPSQSSSMPLQRSSASDEVDAFPSSQSSPPQTRGGSPSLSPSSGWYVQTRAAGSQRSIVVHASSSRQSASVAHGVPASHPVIGLQLSPGSQRAGVTT